MLIRTAEGWKPLTPRTPAPGLPDCEIGWRDAFIFAHNEMLRGLAALAEGDFEAANGLFHSASQATEATRMTYRAERS